MFTTTNIKIVVSIAILFFAFGHASNAQIQYNDCHPTGANASSIGYQTTASGINSFSSGYHAFAEGHSSSAIGYEVTASGNYSIALGRYLQVSQNQSFVIGSGISTSLPLINNIGGIMFGTGSQKHTFFISTAIPNHTGKVAIGNVTEPMAKLHIRGDDGVLSEDASILLEPTDSEKVASIQFWDETKSINVNHDGHLHIRVSNLLLSNDNLTPTAKLHIRSDIGEDAGIILEPKDTENSNTFIQLRDEDHSLTVDNTGAMTLTAGENPLAVQASSVSLTSTSTLTLNGKVGINIDNTYENYDYAFAVDGGILTDDVFIQNVDQWHDAVFKSDYKLMSLSNLKQFVQAHHHLPDVPAEAEVLEQGYDMAEMQGILLKKIEELTLYIIQQEERIEQLQLRVNELENGK